MHAAIIEELFSFYSSSIWLSLNCNAWFHSINIIKFKQHRTYMKFIFKIYNVITAHSIIWMIMM